jgi:hypothetical protein
MDHRRRLNEVLSQVQTLARRLRSSEARATSALDDSVVVAMQSRMTLALRCVDVVLALDEALAEEPQHKTPHVLPHAVLDLSRLAAQGLFTPGLESGQLLRHGIAAFEYRLRQDGEALELELSQDGTGQAVRLASTHPRFGGKRYWFVCPSPRGDCHRRVLHLFQASTRLGFACRVCAGVGSSPRRSRESRALDLSRTSPAVLRGA